MLDGRLLRSTLHGAYGLRDTLKIGGLLGIINPPTLARLLRGETHAPGTHADQHARPGVGQWLQFSSDVNHRTVSERDPVRDFRDSLTQFVPALRRIRQHCDCWCA